LGWRSAVLAGLACCGCAISAPPPSLPNNPFVTQHRIELADRRLAYSAEAGLMPIDGPEAHRLGDMSYFSYAMKGGPGRPIAFIWNGGPGSSSSALHFGAFGPRRLQDGRLIANPNTLLDIADLVFIDQMEAGYGRITTGVERSTVLNPDSDAETYAVFIETFLEDHRIKDRPIVLIGESYGVQRALKVAEKLKTRGILPGAMVLISGYQAVGGQLNREELGALRLPGAIALASTVKPLEAMPASSPQDVFDHVQAWLTPYLDRYAHHETDAELSKQFADGLSKLGGARLISFVKGAVANQDDYIGNTFIMMAHDGMRALDPALRSASLYDARLRSDGSEWISRDIVQDIRASLGFSIDRVYRGQEFETCISGCERLAPEIPPDGLAKSIDNQAGRFRTRAPVTPPPLPLLMAASPDMRVFVIGGIFDDLFPCAIGHEMARRDLKDFAARVDSKCYAGGHMMYFEPPVAKALSTDVKAFIAKASRPSR
jgi:hypothetical protein